MSDLPERHIRHDRLARVPASFFGIVLGLIGLGNSWRAAHDLWGVSAAVGEMLMLIGTSVWSVLILIYLAKWTRSPEAALAEAMHPVQCCFIGLAGVATMLVSIAVAPYSGTLAWCVFLPGMTFTLVFALWRTGTLWKGNRDPAASTPVLYLPSVAGSYVTAIAFATLGHAEWGRLAFGTGVMSWLAIESVLVHRLYTSPEMPPALRPTLGIQLAPPTVGAAAYASVSSGPPDILAYMLIGYGLFQLLLLARLFRWIFAAGVAATAWSFTFGLTALATAMLRFTIRGDTGPVATLAPTVLAVVTALVALIALRTLWLLVTGRILPPVTPTAAQPG